MHEWCMPGDNVQARRRGLDLFGEYKMARAVTVRQRARTIISAP
jgi:hypothetical protein